MMTAKALARDRSLGRQSTPLTLQNAKKVTQFRGEKDLEAMVQRFVLLQTSDALEEKDSAEAAQMAARERTKVQGLAQDLTPESVKQAAREEAKQQ